MHSPDSCRQCWHQFCPSLYHRWFPIVRPKISPPVLHSHFRHPSVELGQMGMSFAHRFDRKTFFLGMGIIGWWYQWHRELLSTTMSWQGWWFRITIAGMKATWHYSFVETCTVYPNKTFGEYSENMLRIFQETRSTPWLLIFWFPASPDHLQLWQ